jgi:hypothetical protein
VKFRVFDPETDLCDEFEADDAASAAEAYLSSTDCELLDDHVDIDVWVRGEDGDVVSVTVSRRVKLHVEARENRERTPGTRVTAAFGCTEEP